MNEKEKAFIDTLDQHQKIVHKVCLMYTENAEDHHDLFQEIVLQLWKGYSNYRGEAKLSTWIYKVSLYTALGILKKQKKSKQAVEVFSEELVSLQYKEEPEENRLDMLQQHISSLDPVDKAIIMLYLEEKSYREIAEIIGITENHVGVKVNRIKTKLRKSVST